MGPPVVVRVYAPMYSTPAYSPMSMSYQSPMMMYYPPPPYYPSQQSSAPQEPLVRATTLVDVGVYDNRFEDATVTVRPGTTVRWRNYGMHKHTVTGPGGQWDSGDLDFGQEYSATFTQPGRYEYYCRHHEGMRGTVIVQGQ